MPRPRNPENDPEAADQFKKELGAKLKALPVPQGSRVRVWAMAAVSNKRYCEILSVGLFRRVGITQLMEFSRSCQHPSL